MAGGGVQSLKLEKKNVCVYATLIFLEIINAVAFFNRNIIVFKPKNYLSTSGYMLLSLLAFLY